MHGHGRYGYYCNVGSWLHTNERKHLQQLDLVGLGSALYVSYYFIISSTGWCFVSLCLCFCLWLLICVTLGCSLPSVSFAIEHSVHRLCVALMLFSLCLFTCSVIFSYVLFCLVNLFHIVVTLCCLLCFCTYAKGRTHVSIRLEDCLWSCWCFPGARVISWWWWSASYQNPGRSCLYLSQKIHSPYSVLCFKHTCAPYSVSAINIYIYIYTR